MITMMSSRQRTASRIHALLLLALVVQSTMALRGSRDLQLEEPLKVTTFRLIQTSNNQVIADLSGVSRVVNIGSIDSGLAIEAVVSGAVRSVRFMFEEDANFKMESYAPYAMCGNDGPQFKPCPGLTVGMHKVTAIPYSMSGGTGESGIPKTVLFRLITNSDNAISAIVPAPAPLPVPVPVPMPVQAPVPAPAPAPVQAPVPAPVPAPVQAPVPAPAPAPVQAPVPAPAPVPIQAPPIPLPTLAFTAPAQCKTPKFVGDWLKTSKYPIGAAEAQGGIIGDDFLVVSGFSMGYHFVTTKNYALSLKNPDGDWVQMDDIPVTEGLTHSAHVVIGTKLYMCGGYLGGHQGPHVNTCLEYDHSIAPGSGKQWKFFPSLPEGRAGGGMIYDPTRNALVFAGGAERPKAGSGFSVDYQHAWMFEFDKPGWRPIADIPFLSNHMSYTSTTDASGKARHYFAGGQMGEEEKIGNIDANYELDAIREIWVKRADMPITRGHASSSTTAVPCGYIIAGGTSNELGVTDDISFYNVESDSWTKIGELPLGVNTPVCDIDYARGMYYCETGWSVSLLRP